MHSAHPSRGLSLHYWDANEYSISQQRGISLPNGEHAGFGFVLKGSAQITLEARQQRRTAKAAYGEIFFIPPDCSCTLQNNDKQLAQVIHIRFECNQAPMRSFSPGGPESVRSALPCTGDLRLYRFRMPRVRSWIQDCLSVSRQPSLYFQVQSYLYAIAAEFIAMLEKPKPSDDGLLDYVLQMKQSIQEHCGEALDIQEVAGLSGGSYTRFYQMFKKHTGFSPLKFTTITRLKESLRLLANRPASIMEVAHCVGYSDELYFSRLFKKHMGLTPTEYAQAAKTRIANLCPVFRGDLSVLGLTPVMELGREWYDDPDKDKYYKQVEQCRPELIFTAPVPDEVYHTLMQIAPVVMIRWKGYPWKERLQQISETLGIPSVAEWWLSYFQTKIDHTRAHLREHLREEPFLVVSALEPFYRVYGMQRTKIRDLFYDELKMRPPASASEIPFLDVSTLAEVAALECGNILILAPASRSDESCIQLEEEWLELHRSRKQKRCILIRHEEPLLYNASFYEGLLDQFVDLLIG